MRIPSQAASGYASNRSMGAFSHSVNCMINFKQHRGCRIQDPGTRGKHQQTKKNISGVPAGTVGRRIQDPGTRGYRWWKTADFSHSAGTAHGAPPTGR